MLISFERASNMRDHLLSYDFFDDTSLDRILPFFEQRVYKKKELLQRAGTISQEVYFIHKGCVRSFLLDSDGKEHTILFGTEGYWMGDLQSFTKKSFAAYNYQSIEDTEVFAINKSSWDLLMREESLFLKYVGILFRNALIVQQERIVELFTLSAEERYEKLKLSRRDLLNRVPQKHIASYIGITPEFLSQIRKNQSSFPSN